MNRAIEAAAVVALISLSGCDQARSTSYFEANPQEASAVARACVAGTHRGRECDNAQAAVSKQRFRAEIDAWDEMAGRNHPQAEKK